KHVNRTFELVAKAVSPAVFHIVAQKSTRPEDNRRARHFEETGAGVIIRCDRAAGPYVLTSHPVVDRARPAKSRVSSRAGRSISPTFSIKTFSRPTPRSTPGIPAGRSST